MSHGYIVVERYRQPFAGTTHLLGAKNAALVIIASLILAPGKSILRNVPLSEDVHQMLELLVSLGATATIHPHDHTIVVDTSTITSWTGSVEAMRKTRASILILGPLLARFGRAHVGLPGGDAIGKRPIDYHLKNFVKMGATISECSGTISAVAHPLRSARLVLEYPSVGATENALMAATLAQGTTTIINAALEPEVFDLIRVLQTMGASITIEPPATIVIQGVSSLSPVEHTLISDRLEAGALLTAVAMTGGSIYLPDAPAYLLDIFLEKLSEMGHTISVGAQGLGVTLQATSTPCAVSIKTAPYPGFPTDLQATFMAAQTVAQGSCVIEETVFENRLSHAYELAKMGACIKVEYNKVYITGVEQLTGTYVTATDIRASCALVLAGLVAQGTTTVAGLHHWKRGYEALEKKLQLLGAGITLSDQPVSTVSIPSLSATESQIIL
ncbi:UDP-N-acetylglucosamine 1-carboxyvinyltransferase [Vermiphilus pyriformis]|nr:MAG: UDP-N-acetylglucosamine 1-carboxyvinyltransferase [Vermiphilus pyriformis]